MHSYEKLYNQKQKKMLYKNQVTKHHGGETPKKQNDHLRKIILTTELFLNTGTILLDVIFLCCGFIPLGGNLG